MPHDEPIGDRPARILIVDDHEDNVDLLQTRLEAWGYLTSSANDGDVALRMIEENPPDTCCSTS